MAVGRLGGWRARCLSAAAAVGGSKAAANRGAGGGGRAKKEENWLGCLYPCIFS
jgi:hypothetical protein